MKENSFLIILSATITLIAFIVEWYIQEKLRKEDEKKQINNR